MKKINLKAVLVLDALIFGAIIIILTNNMGLTKPMEDVGNMQLSYLNSWVTVLEIVFTGTMLIFALFDWQLEDIIMATSVSIAIMIATLGVLGATNAIEAAGLVLCFGILNLKTALFSNCYIKIGLAVTIGGLVVSLFGANILSEIITCVGIVVIALIGQLELIKYVALKSYHFRIK